MGIAVLFPEESLTLWTVQGDRSSPSLDRLIHVHTNSNALTYDASVIRPNNQEFDRVTGHKY